MFAVCAVGRICQGVDPLDANYLVRSVSRIVCFFFLSPSLSEFFPYVWTVDGGVGGWGRGWAGRLRAGTLTEVNPGVRYAATEINTTPGGLHESTG